MNPIKNKINYLLRCAYPGLNTVDFQSSVVYIRLLLVDLDLLNTME